MLTVRPNGYFETLSLKEERPLTKADFDEGMQRLRDVAAGRWSIHRFRYKWEGADVHHFGFMADEVAPYRPDAIRRTEAGSLMLDYEALTPPGTIGDAMGPRRAW